ncbi:MAG TPA: response regulator, partial [Kofleriaceae bacterium]|nr:response regulator [Kofleriaceae bacterium]
MNRRTVMVVDDNALMRKLLRLTLEGERFAVLDHADGGAALAAATAELPDLVIQDLVLGDMSGLDLVRALRELPGGEELPIIAVTGLPSHAMEARDERTFDQVLVKPVSPARLLEVVRELLPADVPPRRPAGAAPTVLVVDHHREDARALTAHLAERGFVVAVAADALEAMTAARNRRPDAILSALVTAHG